MELTEKQQRYVSHYISEIEDKIADQLSQKQRERALTRLRMRIDEKIKALPGDSTEDADVLGMLHKMGQPETQAAILVRVWGDAADINSVTPTQAEPASRPAPLATAPVPASGGLDAEPADNKPAASERASSKKKTRGPVWLGVALYLSQRFGLPLWALRTLFLLLGLITGPASLLLYMIVFVGLRLRKCVKAPAPFHPFRVVFYPLLTGVMITLFYFGGVYGLEGIRMAHESYLERPVPELQEWAWLAFEAETMYLTALVVLLPLALLCAMPLANTWDYSLKRFTQAGVALYAIAVSFGLASFITGIILNFVSEFAG